MKKADKFILNLCLTSSSVFSVCYIKDCVKLQVIVHWICRNEMTSG